MAYTMEDIRKSQEIFYYLLEKHELREEDEQALYKAYTEEEDIQNIVKSQAETASCDIERYGNTIYLIPQEENNFLGYSRVELKKEEKHYGIQTLQRHSDADLEPARRVWHRQHGQAGP